MTQYFAYKLISGCLSIPVPEMPNSSDASAGPGNLEGCSVQPHRVDTQPPQLLGQRLPYDFSGASVPIQVRLCVQ